MATHPTPPADLAGRRDVEPSRARRLASPLGTAALAAIATTALHVRDPHVGGSWGACPTALLGFACPFCGGLRAVNDLTNLDIGAAASSNLLLVVALPVIVLLWVRRVAACWRGGTVMAPLAPPMWMWWALAAVAGGFMLLRNLPGSWLAP
ncbi:DUF2752 domain-containing protein [Nocardioides sp. InS609-2]|uniref:DUF2752 domain-containing protein n=1 Tax=Nocardioides sp. InS609-2 TaxID=2760705 RepID=UPI0020C08171|nr:DUF2752 domain-containing protein [Nocardioides sp. InS609-2]